MKPEKSQKHRPKEKYTPIQAFRRGQHGEDGIKWQSLQKKDRRILFDVFFNNKKTAYLDYLKRTFHVFLNLHPSFWKNEYFLRWQIIRLNPEYRTAVEKIWRDRWANEGKGNQQQIEEYFFDFRDCIPSKTDTFETWEFAGWISEDNNGRRRFGIEVRDLMEKWHVDFPPIPWVFRFIPRGHLNQLPPIPGVGYGKLRGRPIEDWAKNLLVYELSHAGMKDMEMARLMFGVKKSTEWSAPKHPIIVKIAKTKGSMEKLISQAYPPRTTSVKKPRPKSHVPSADDLTPFLDDLNNL